MRLTSDRGGGILGKQVFTIIHHPCSLSARIDTSRNRDSRGGFRLLSPCVGPGFFLLLLFALIATCVAGGGDSATAPIVETTIRANAGFDSPPPPPASFDIIGSRPTASPTPAPTPEPTAAPTAAPAPASQPSYQLSGSGVHAPVTFYPCSQACGDPAGPLPLAEGQFACGYGWALGTVLHIVGDPLGPAVCNDRGWLAPYQVDRFFWSDAAGWAWQHAVGSYALITPTTGQ
jgi:hypothetical protein